MSPFSDEPWPVVDFGDRSDCACPPIRSFPGALCAWPRPWSAVPAPRLSLLPLVSLPPDDPGDVFAPDEPDDMPLSGAPPAPPAPSLIPCADARPTPANSATVPSKNFLVLRCIVTFLSDCSRKPWLPFALKKNRCACQSVPVGGLIGHERGDVRTGTVPGGRRRSIVWASVVENAVPQEQNGGSYVGLMTVREESSGVRQ